MTIQDDASPLRLLSASDAGGTGSGDAGEPRRPITILSNRLPVRWQDGQWSLSPGGLVTAMLPVMRSTGARWIGWDGRIDDEESTDQDDQGRTWSRFEHDGLDLARIPLSQKDHAAYYRAISNETIWPLFHDGVRHPSYDARPWDRYERVNKRFADAAASLAPKDSIVWIHDYHLLLVPGLLRAMRPDLRIGLFIHIPIPPLELFATLPWREQILASLGCADLIGTQTQADADHMSELIASDRCNPKEGQRHDGASEEDQFGADQQDRHGRPIVKAFPISIDAKRYCRLAREAEEQGRIADVRDRLCSGRRTLLLGVDRLDYTKGIDRRLEALEFAFEKELLDPSKVCFVQVAVPSREAVADYQAIGDKVDALVGRINGVYGGMNGPVVLYIKEGLSEQGLVPLYRAADVMVITPLRDGMNLVAKEYVASRYDHTGQLILSEFAGAAAELREASLVNPHDTEGLAKEIAAACKRHIQDDPSIKKAMARMHEHVMTHDVHRWSAAFLESVKTPDSDAHGTGQFQGSRASVPGS